MEGISSWGYSNIGRAFVPHVPHVTVKIDHSQLQCCLFKTALNKVRPQTSPSAKRCHFWINHREIDGLSSAVINHKVCQSLPRAQILFDLVVKRQSLNKHGTYAFACMCATCFHFVKMFLSTATSLTLQLAT